MRHDSLLKSIFFAPSSRMIRRLTGSRAVEQLNTEFPSVEKRAPDLVARLDDGRILHLEIQSTNDAEMPWRMLQYWIPLARRYPEREIVQIVLYVGNRRMSMRGSIQTSALAYRHELVDVRDLDPAEFLESPLMSERVIALLCGGGTPREKLRRVLRSWSKRPRKEIADLLEKLVIVSGLRKIEESVVQEIQSMPLDIEELIRENTVIQRWISQGRDKGVMEGREKGLRQGLRQGLQQGIETVLVRLIEHRFGPVPAWAMKRIHAAKPQQLEEWAVRLLDAPSLKQALS